MTDILMPALSPTMEEGTLSKWHIKAGDTVSAGDVIAEIETDKATMEVEAVDEGEVAEILVPEGSEGVKVNAVIARLKGEGGLVAPAPKVEAPKAEAAPAKAEPAAAPSTPSGSPSPASGDPRGHRPRRGTRARAAGSAGPVCERPCRTEGTSREPSGSHAQLIPQLPSGAGLTARRLVFADRLVGPVHLFKFTQVCLDGLAYVEGLRAPGPRRKRIQTCLVLCGQTYG